MFNLFNLFGNKQERPKVKGFALDGFAILHDMSYDKFYEFYEQSPYISSVINRIRRDVGAHGHEIRIGENLNEKLMNEYEELLKKTNLTPRSLIKRLVRDFEITGNAYLYLARDGNKVEAIQVLDPRYIKPIANTNGQILGYIQNLNGIRYFTTDEVFHFKDDPDINNETIGRSKMKALFIDLATDKEASESNYTFFKNNQTPASFIILDDAFAFPPIEAEEQKIKKELKEIFESGNKGGASNHRSIVTQGIKQIIKAQDKVTDGEFLNLRKFTLELVCAIYGVNKDVLGYTETSNRATGGNQSDNYFMLIEDKEDLVDEFMTQVIKQVFGDNVSYHTMKDNLRTLRIKSELATNLYNSDLITRNEAREIIQYENHKDGEQFKTKQQTQDEEEIEDDKVNGNEDKEEAENKNNFQK